MVIVNNNMQKDVDITIGTTMSSFPVLRKNVYESNPMLWVKLKCMRVKSVAINFDIQMIETIINQIPKKKRDNFEILRDKQPTEKAFVTQI